MPITMHTYRCLHDSPLPEVEPSMSNFDHYVEPGMAEALEGGRTMADYAGWNFHAYVYSPRPGVFVADVHQWHAHAGLFEASTLEDIMSGVSDEWGAE